MRLFQVRTVHRFELAADQEPLLGGAAWDIAGITVMVSFDTNTSADGPICGGSAVALPASISTADISPPAAFPQLALSDATPPETDASELFSLNGPDGKGPEGATVTNAGVVA